MSRSQTVTVITRRRTLWRWVAAPFWAVGFCVLGPLSVFLVSCWLGGYRLQPVLTGSMAPTYPPGALVVVAPVDPGDVTVGSPIAFEVGGGALVTHRVVEVVRDEVDGLEFRTQGDHNASPDEDLVPARRVRGEVRWSVTKVGWLLVWLRWPRGFLVTTVPALVLFVLGEVAGLLRRMRAP